MRKLLTNKWLYVVLAALAGWWWFSHQTNNAEKNAVPAVNVSVAPAMHKNVPIQVQLVGTVVAYETVAVKSRLDMQQIMDVKFHDGDFVKEGQVLFVLDDRTIKADIKQMEAALEKEKAQLVNSKLQYERALKLVKTNAVAQASVDEAKAAYEAQLAQVGAAQANLDAARVQLTYTVITAPISGRTGTINVTRGNNVKANDTTPLVTINQITPIRVQFSIPQRYYDQIRSAMAQDQGLTVIARHTTTESQDSAEGKLEYVDNAIDASNGTVAARAVFPNADEKLWPGMFVNVTLNLGTEKNALTIPAVAVQGDENNHFVFVVDPADSKALKTPVTITQNDGTTAIVSQGLSDGQQVVTDGILRLIDGSRVEIVKSGAAPIASPAKP